VILKKIVYNFYKSIDELYFPNAYIVSVDARNSLFHVQHKAYSHHLSDDKDILVHKPLFELIEKLSLDSLQKRFIGKKSKIKDLSGLLADSKTKKTVLNYIYRKLDEFLNQLVKYNLPLCLELDRNAIAKDYEIKYSESVLKPILNFEKNNEGISYKLRLKSDDSVWKINTKNIIALCDFPGWIIADKFLYRLENINGALIKPFRQKEEIHIPERMIKTYFEKFILRVAKKADISAKGFDVIVKNKLQGCKISVFKNFFNQHWEINLTMVYEGADFDWRDKRDNKTGINFSDDNILLTKTVRNHKEEKYFVDIILEKGLVNISGNSFVPVSNTRNLQNPTAILEWLASNYLSLNKYGFEIENPIYKGKKIRLSYPKLKINTGNKIDWFDVEATVIIGEADILFSSLKQNILDNNPYFELPDGSVFIIPQEWMVKYSELFKFAENNSGRLKLTKSQFTILENAGISVDIEPKTTEKKQFDIPKSLNADLRPYQIDGVNWLLDLQFKGLGACLADDMGLGKTLQTLTALLYTKEHKLEKIGNNQQKIIQLSLFSNNNDIESNRFSSLIVLPASLIYNWISEIQKFTPLLTFYNYTGAKRIKNIPYISGFNIILTTYQTALRDVDFLKEIDFDYIILDESQQIKNRKSKIFNAITKLKSKYKISLSGTPIENSLSDLWSQMQFINKELLGSYSFFEKEFLKPVEKYNDEDKLIQLKKIVKPFLLRRTKGEVEKNLPELMIKIHYSEMLQEQKKLYAKEKSAARNYLLKIFDEKQGKYKFEILKVLNRLRQLANHPLLEDENYSYESGKFNDIMTYWEDIHKAGHKVLIFSSYVKYLNILKEEFERRNIRYSFLSGEMSQQKRKREIEDFNSNDDISTFLMSIKAGGTGLNLTAADYVFILDPWWNPTTEQQAIARAHRIGQDKKVIAVKFITHDTLEEKILQLQQRKSRLAEDILNNNEKIKLDKKDIIYLLE